MIIIVIMYLNLLLNYFLVLNFFKISILMKNNNKIYFLKVIKDTPYENRII